MSALDVGIRGLPNLYVDFVSVDKINLTSTRNLPKMTVSFVIKDVEINNRPMWSKDPMTINGTNVVICLEDKEGHPYHVIREPLMLLMGTPSIQTDTLGNTIYIYRFTKTIDARTFYNKDRSLIIKSYIEKKYDNNTTRTSSIMREAVQNSDGSTPKRSFYFTLPGGAIYAGPFHYHSKTKQYMVGEKHSPMPHPKLNLHYVQNKSVDSSVIQKNLNFVNNNKNTYDFNPKEISTNYVTINTDKSVSNLFVLDLYKILLSSDSKARKLFELNKPLFNELSRELSIHQMTIGRVELGTEKHLNILQTPVFRSSEKTVQKRLISVENVKEGRVKNENVQVDSYYDQGILYSLLTDQEIKSNVIGKFKYVANIKFKSTISKYIDKRIKSVQKIKSYYETMLLTLNNPDYYDNFRDKLQDNYIRSIFGNYTDFQVDESNNIIFNQTPEFHKHIDTFVDAMSLIKFVNSEELEEIHISLNQLINPLETSKNKISHFVKSCNQLIYQIKSAYKINRAYNNRRVMKKSSLLQMEFRDNVEFEYDKREKAYNIFKNLDKPIITLPDLKSRFTLERSRYYQKTAGKTTFDTLPAPKRSAFISDKETKFSFLTPISLQTSKKTIDLQNFDMFDAVVNDVYTNPKLRVQKKIPSTLTQLKKKISHIDAADFLSEASDFVINKSLSPARLNAVKTVDPMVLNYTFPLNSIVDVDRDKFDLDKQENLLLKFTKTLPPEQTMSALRNIPFQTKSLFYLDNIKNPLNRIKQSSSYKVKRLIKNVAFTTYKVEYLSGYLTPADSNGFRNILRPVFKKMEDPSKIVSTAKYILIKTTSFDRFGFKSAAEFRTNQSFLLLKNKKYLETLTTLSRGSRFQRTYNPEDFSVQSFQTLNLLNNSMGETIGMFRKDVYEYDISKSKLILLQNIKNSTTSNNRSREMVNKRPRRPISAPKPPVGIVPPTTPVSTTSPASTPSPAPPAPTTITPTGTSGGGY